MMKQRAFPLMTFGIIGLLIFIFINWFPMLSDETDLQQETLPNITKEQAEELALNHLRQAATRPLGELESLVMLQSHMHLSGYLKKQKLDTSYYEMWGTQYPLDYYQVEITDGTNYWLVDISMQQGNMIGWRESSAKVATSSNIDQQTLLDYAAKLGYSSDSLTYNDDLSEDGHSIYDVKDTQIGDAHLQLHFYTDEQSIVGFHPEFSVPQSFLDWYSKQRQWMDTMQMISLGMYLLNAIGAISLAVIYKHTISFRRGLLLTGIFIVLSVIQDFNSYPMLRSVMPGQSESDTVLMINTMFGYVLTFMIALTLYLGLVSGDAVWREKGFKLWARWQESDYGQHVLTAMGRGYLLSCVLLAVQSLLYLAGEKFFGVWGINDPQMSPYNLLIPLLFPILAWIAAISEEAIYRVFSAALFKKLFRSTVVAVLISNMIWALAHIGYPFFPAYTRFVEVTILGVIFSWAYFRYGFITVVFAHAIFDSILMSLAVASMGKAGYAPLSLLYIVLPAVIAYAIYWIHPILHRRTASIPDDRSAT